MSVTHMCACGIHEHFTKLTNGLLKSIIDYYLQRGYITSRAYLPQQDLTSGQLQIVVVEGRIEGMDSSRVVSDRDPALLALPGGLGNTIRLLTAADGNGQLGTGIYQGMSGDTWNAAGNIALGALKVTGGIG